MTTSNNQEQVLGLTKISSFSTSVLAEAIAEFNSTPFKGGNFLDSAWGSKDEIIFAMVDDDEVDADSFSACQVSTFKDRDVNGDTAVYISARRRSVFSGNMEQIETLFDEGYKIYVIDEHEHSAISLKLASSTEQEKGEVLSGNFRKGLGRTCQFDSSFAFLAYPESWGAPSPESLDEFENWLNGYGKCFAVLSAKLVKDDQTHESSYEVTVLDSCHGYLGDKYAEESAYESLNAEVTQRENQMQTASA